MDGLAGTEEGGAFAQRWHLLTQELAPSLPEAEREALAHRATLDELGRYLEAARLVVEFELSYLDPEAEPSTGQMIGIERHRAFLNRYEDENSSELGGLTSQASAAS